MEKNKTYIHAQQEKSDTGFVHLKCFAEMKYAMFFGNARNQLDVKFVTLVPGKEKIKVLEYCTKEETRIPDMEGYEFGQLDKYDHKRLSNITVSNAIENVKNPLVIGTRC